MSTRDPKEYEATVDEIVPQADAPSRSFLVKAALPQAEGLFEGMFGRLRIPVGSTTSPLSADAAVQQRWGSWSLSRWCTGDTVAATHDSDRTTGDAGTCGSAQRSARWRRGGDSVRA